MRAIRRLLAKLKNFFFRGPAERDLAREIDAHLALLQDDFEGRGMTPEEARRAARRAYGGIEQAKEVHRDERSLVWLEQLLQDLRQACRGLVRCPALQQQRDCLDSLSQRTTSPVSESARCGAVGSWQRRTGPPVRTRWSWLVTRFGSAGWWRSADSRTYDSTEWYCFHRHW